VLPVPLDEWGIDALVTGSQKALMLPPGLGFIALSERAWQKTKKAKLPRFISTSISNGRIRQRLRRFYTGGVFDFRSTRVAQHDGAGRFRSRLRQTCPHGAGNARRRQPPWD
jgi:aspartate aminotransferase-like enzyme